MKTLRKYLAFLMVAVMLTLTACSPQSKQESAAIKSVKTINQIFADGQKVTNVVVEYDQQIDASSISPDSFTVKDRKITSVHTNNQAARTDKNVDGNYVVLDLEVQSPLLADQYATDGRMVEYVANDSATVVQAKNIKATDGTIYSASKQEFSTTAKSGMMPNDSKIYLTRDKFEENHFYTDPDWKVVLHYNLYKPEGYTESDPNAKYPLVLFMPDAGAVTSDWETVLKQGNGGTVWAEDGWQADHPCFVVTMIYDDKFINDYWEYYESYVEGTMNLVRSLSKQYPIDTNRIYTTGQSMGAMASLVMMTKDPNLFAAAYCVACKWDTKALLPLKDSNLFILTSEDDPATKSMLQATDAWENTGTTVAKANIDGIADQETLSKNMSDLLSQKTNIYYCRIKAGTGSMDLEGNPLPGSHRYTWRLAYNLPGVKEWLFAQSK